MSPVPEDLALAPWSSLQERLAGYFAARARGLLAPEFVLSGRGGEAFGRLRVHGPEGAEFEAGDTRAEIKRTGRSGYRMVTGGAQTLAAEPARGTSDALEVRCKDRFYEARVYLLRNTAVARSSGGEEVARVTGGLTNRGYEAVFDAGVEGSLPIAVFLLYHTVALRRRAFRAGASESEAANP